MLEWSLKRGSLDFGVEDFDEVLFSPKDHNYLIRRWPTWAEIEHGRLCLQWNFFHNLISYCWPSNTGNKWSTVRLIFFNFIVCIVVLHRLNPHPGCKIHIVHKMMPLLPEFMNWQPPPPWQVKLRFESPTNPFSSRGSFTQVAAALMIGNADIWKSISWHVTILSAKSTLTIGI